MTPRFMTEPTEEGQVSLIRQEHWRKGQFGERRHQVHAHVEFPVLLSKEDKYTAGYKNLKTRTEDLVRDINLKVINIYIKNEVAV